MSRGGRLAGVPQIPFNLPPLAAADYHSVIEGPAERVSEAGRPLALEAGLIAALLADAQGVDALPLLGFTLERLYNEHGGDGALTLDDYIALGGVQGSIEAAVAEAFAAPEAAPRIPADGAERETLLKRLVPHMGVNEANGEPVRRLARQADLPEAGRGLIDRLITQRLLVADRRGEETVIEVAHEALLRRWPTLRRWHDQERAALVTQQEIARAASAWSQNDRGADWLAHRGARLAEAEKVARREDFTAAFEGAPRAYLEACRYAEDAARDAEAQRLARQRVMQRRVGILLTTVAIVTLVAGWLVVAGRRDLAQQRSRLIAGIAKDAFEDDQHDRAMRLALVASQGSWLLPSSVDAGILLGHAAHFSRFEAQLTGHDGSVRSAAFSPNGDRIVTASDDNTARVWSRAKDGSWNSVLLQGHRNSVNSAAFSPDGNVIVTGSIDRTARVWSRGPDGRWRSVVLRGHRSDVNSAAFSPSGDCIVTASQRQQLPASTSRGPDGGWTASALQGHRNPVYSAVFSPDGDRIVATSSDNTARVWSQEARTTPGIAFPSKGISITSTRRPFRRTVNASRPHPTTKQRACGAEIKTAPGTVCPSRGMKHTFSRRHSHRMATASSPHPWTRQPACGAETKRAPGMASPFKGIEKTSSRPPSRRMATASSPAFLDGTAPGCGAEIRTAPGAASPSKDIKQPSSRRPSRPTVTASSPHPGTRPPAFGEEAKTAPGTASPSKGISAPSIRRPSRRTATALSPGPGTSPPACGIRVRTAVGTASPSKGISAPSIRRPSRRTATASSPHPATPPPAFGADDGTAPGTASSSKGIKNRSTRQSSRRTATASSPPLRTTPPVCGAEARKALEEHPSRRASKPRLLGGLLAGWRPHCHRIPGQDRACVEPRPGRLLEKRPSKGASRLGRLGGVLAGRRAHRHRTQRGRGRPRVESRPQRLLAQHLPPRASETLSFSAAFSLDGDRIVTASQDKTARVWTRGLDGSWNSVVLQGHGGWVSSAAFSPDGGRIVTASQDQTARVWSRGLDGSWNSVPLQGHRGFVRSAVFSPDGGRIVTASDQTARVWDVRWLMGPGDWAKAEPLSLPETVCREKLQGSWVTAEDPKTGRNVQRIAARLLTPADVQAAPLLAGREGEDVCAPFVEPKPWWSHFAFWR